MSLNIDRWMQLPTAALHREAKVPLRVEPDRAALYAAFAREIADEIKPTTPRANRRGLFCPSGRLGSFPC